MGINTGKTPTIKPPTVGRIVHFFPCKPLSEGWTGREKVYPAIVVRNEDLLCLLAVFTDAGTLYFNAHHKSSVFVTSPSGAHCAHYWDWPEIN